jgi:hypothetical protein
MTSNQTVPEGNRVSRREFLRRYGVASSAITLSPFFLDRLTTAFAATANFTRVYKVKNGDCFQNTAKLWEMLGGPANYIAPTDIVVIKGNAQWYNQGYTHTGCIKGVIDQILAIPNFSGEVIICDNVQSNDVPGALGFDATANNRTHNWPDHNWNSLAAQYQALGRPVATKKWTCGPWRNITSPGFSNWDPANGAGWARSFFIHNTRPTFLSYPVFESPLTPGRLIDMKNGVWENGGYTERKVKAIFMPTLNNHGYGGEDYAGVTSAIKSFFGATEIPATENGVWNGYYHIHSSSYTQSSARSAGELVGGFINTLYAPMLYITAAMWAGHHSRTELATETKTVLACENPVTLDYISCRDVISPYAAWLNPHLENNTRKQILGCNSQGIGTLNPQEIEVLEYDFNRPTATRLDIERKMRDFKVGVATEQEVKDVIKLYLDGD